ncbi:MAG: N-acetyl sugar amidotransferase [Pirellulales bacterium]|nr:N-acetyl sugar amidotransferase [Pirellulales bacterium]
MAKPAGTLCRRCVINSSIPGVHLDAEGICNHCHIHDRLNAMFPLGEEGTRRLQEIVDRIRRDGRGKPFDCVVGLSGGRDTCYCLYKCKQLGLRPLAVHFDNGWDSDIAKNNIRKICTGLDVELHTIIADWEESRELTNCTIRASLPYIDLTDDIGIVHALYSSADKEGVRWIIHSHSFRCEGINPLLWNYMDGRFVRHLIKRFCRIRLKHFKNVDLRNFLYWVFVKRIKVFTMTNYYQDAGEEIDELLKREFGWENTGGWHFDNEIFGLQCYYSRHKFGIDWRVVELAALVREKQMTRDAALAELAEVPAIERKEIVDYALKKQGISPAEWAEIMAAPPKFFTDYPSYYPVLRVIRLPIKVLCRLNILPPHAYEKYFEM